MFPTFIQPQVDFCILVLFRAHGSSIGLVETNLLFYFRGLLKWKFNRQHTNLKHHQGHSSGQTGYNLHLSPCNLGIVIKEFQGCNVNEAFIVTLKWWRDSRTVWIHVIPNPCFFFKIAKNLHNYLQYERVLKIILLSYFLCRHIWLNILKDDCHLSNITRLETRKSHSDFFSLIFCEESSAIKVTCKVSRLEGENGQFRQNRASNA